ncbi:MAG: tetratricopeptide repeat protein [Gammaproteobacteria bacterium]
MLNTEQIKVIENFIQHMLIQTVRLLPLAETTTDKVATFVNNIFQINEREFKGLFDEPVSPIMQQSLNHLQTQYDRGYQTLFSTQQETQEALHSLVNNPDIYLLIAESMFVAENYPEAIKSWTQYNTLTHNNPNEVLYNVALAEAKLGRYYNAALHFLIVLRMNPIGSTKAHTLHNRGVIAATLGLLPIALTNFKQARTITPNAPDTLRCCAHVQSQLTHQESPKTFFTKHGFFSASTGGSSSTAQNIEPSNPIRPSSN